MTQLANFFDGPLQKKIPAKEIPPPEISRPEISVGLDSVNRLAGSCSCDSLWLDAYGIWRCEICFPPIFENEIRERKNLSAKNLIVKNIVPENPPAENLPAEEILNVRILPAYFFNDDQLWSHANLENQEPPCNVCGSLAFWWSILDVRHCQRCQPRPKRSRELLELAPKLRRQAKVDSARLAESRLAEARADEISHLAEQPRLDRLAKTDAPTKE